MKNSFARREQLFAQNAALALRQLGRPRAEDALAWAAKMRRAANDREGEALASMTMRLRTRASRRS